MSLPIGTYKIMNKNQVCTQITNNDVKNKLFSNRKGCANRLSTKG